MIETAFKFEEVIAMLDRSVCRVVFYKVDGTLREMIGTRLADKIPQKFNSSKDNWRETGELVRLYDIEKEGWRSFVMTNLVFISEDLND